MQFDPWGAGVPSVNPPHAEIRFRTCVATTNANRLTIGNHGDRSIRTVSRILGILITLLLTLAAALPLYGVGRAIQSAESPDLGLLVARWAILLRNSAALLSCTLALLLPVSLAFAWFLTRCEWPGRRGAFVAVSLLASLPPVVHATFTFAFAPTWAYPQSVVACALATTYAFVGLATILLTRVLSGVPRVLEDAARLDAAPAAVFFHVTLALAAPGIAATAAVLAWFILTDFTLSDLWRVRTFAEEVYTEFALSRTVSAPVLAGAPALIAAGVVVLALKHLHIGAGAHEIATNDAAAAEQMISIARFGTGSRAAITPIAAGLFSLGVGYPVGVLVSHVGTPRAFVESLRATGPELALSLVLSASCAFLIVALCVAVGWASRTAAFARRGGACVSVLLLATPAPILGVTLIDIFNRPGILGEIYDSPAILLIGLLIRSVPIGLLLLSAAAQRLPAEIDALAELDGATGLQRYRHLAVPLLARDAVVVGFVLAVFCFGEAACSILLSPPGLQPAAVRAFTLLHFGIYRDLAALTLAISACVMTLVGLAALAVRWIDADSKSSTEARN